MPAAPPAVNATTGGSEQAKTAPGYGRRRGQAPPRRGAAGRAQPAQQRSGFLLRRIPKTRATYPDPLFARPDLIEDDYYRFRRRLDS